MLKQAFGVFYAALFFAAAALPALATVAIKFSNHTSRPIIVEFYDNHNYDHAASTMTLWPKQSHEYATYTDIVMVRFVAQNSHDSTCHGWINVTATNLPAILNAVDASNGRCEIQRLR